jgi:hypothetical protein
VGSSRANVKRPRGAEQARSRKHRQARCFRAARPSHIVRAAISSAPVERIGLGRPFRAPQRSQAGSIGHFERHSGAKQARCRKRWQVRCFRGQAEPAKRVSAWNVQAINVYIYIYIIIHWLGFRKCKKSVCMFALKLLLFKFVIAIGY